MKVDPMQMYGIVRYANRVRIKEENLAEHSYSTALYIFDIAKEFKIDDAIRNEAIAMAVIHDIGEIFTSDLPHDVKYENPELKVLCDKLEKKYINRCYSIRNLWYKLETNGDTVQKLIVKVADSMSVEAYAKRELDLGNSTKEMKQILKDARKRIRMYKATLRNKLKEEV
nr:MAG TPA: putative hydrolase [Caudoviricetes sp.]